MTRTLDSDSQLTLMARAGTGHTTGQNLASFGNEPAKLCNILIIDHIDLVDAEIANLFAALAATTVFSFRSLVSFGHD